MKITRYKEIRKVKETMYSSFSNFHYDRTSYSHPIENLKYKLRASKHYCNSTKSLDYENYDDIRTFEMTNKKKIVERG